MDFKIVNEVLLQNIDKYRLDRGRDYYKKGYIEESNYSKEENKISFYGSIVSKYQRDIYDSFLIIDIDNKEIISSGCTCEDFNQNTTLHNNFICKHIASITLKGIDELKVNIVDNLKLKTLDIKEKTKPKVNTRFINKDLLNYFKVIPKEKVNIEVDITIGVSAGSCHASSYISKQYKRAFNATIDYVNDKKYLSFGNLIKTGSIFGMDFIFNTIPNELNIYDYDAFSKSKTKFVVVTTNCETGKPEYFELTDLNKEIIYMQASCSIPVFANIVEIDNYKLVDGGVTDSIPIEYALNQGYKKNIVVLTRDITYRKGKQKFISVVKRKYKKYPKLVNAIESRHIDKLTALYKDGYNDAKELSDKILDFINKAKN